MTVRQTPDFCILLVLQIASGEKTLDLVSEHHDKSVVSFFLFCRTLTLKASKLQPSFFEENIYLSRKWKNKKTKKCKAKKDLKRKQFQRTQQWFPAEKISDSKDINDFTRLKAEYPRDETNPTSRKNTKNEKAFFKIIFDFRYPNLN